MRRFQRFPGRLAHAQARDMLRTMQGSIAKTSHNNTRGRFMIRVRPSRKTLLVAALTASLATGAAAFQDQSMAAFATLGAGDNSTRMLSAGVTVPWTRWTLWTPGPGTSWHGEFFVSDWNAPHVDGGGRRNYVQLGAVGVWRHRWGEGSSPWFVEAGLGVTVMNRLYRTPQHSFSTTFQFVETLGIGRSFGENGQHEVSLQLQHYSNGSIKKPNPGINFARVRYSYRF